MKALLILRTLAVVVRAARRHPDVYPEDELERQLDRFTPSSFNRFVATELVLMASAVRYLAGGFRAPLPPGYSYVRRWASVPLLLAIPVLSIPEMLVLDFVLWNAAAWRLASDVLHIYAMLWFVGVVATTRLRPHRIEPARLRLRFGCMKRLDLERSNIATATVHGSLDDPAARRRVTAGSDNVAMTLSGVPVVELTLRKPVAFRPLLGRARNVGRVLVAVDDPTAFAAAVAA